MHHIGDKNYGQECRVSVRPSVNGGTVSGLDVLGKCLRRKYMQPFALRKQVGLEIGSGAQPYFVVGIVVAAANDGLRRMYGQVAHVVTLFAISAYGHVFHRNGRVVIYA